MRRRSISERFWPKVDKDGPVPAHRPDLGPCWIWTGFIAREGYGRINAGGKTGPILHAHRVPYEMVHGPIPAGLELDHLCRVRSCVRPTHLEAVTHQVNSQRGETGAHLRNRTHCPYGHPYDDANTYFTTDGGRRRCRACLTAKNIRYANRQCQDCGKPVTGAKSPRCRSCSSRVIANARWAKQRGEMRPQ